MFQCEITVITSKYDAWMTTCIHISSKNIRENNFYTNRAEYYQSITVTIVLTDPLDFPFDTVEI